MKKVKIVLTAITALGVLGGVIASKAKTRYGDGIYYVNKRSNDAPSATITGKFFPGTSISYYYTTEFTGMTGTTLESFTLVP